MPNLPALDIANGLVVSDVLSNPHWQQVALLVILSLSIALLLAALGLGAKRRRLEGELRLRRDLLNAMCEGMCGVDHQGLCRFANPAMLKMLGYTEAEVLGKSLHALFLHHHADGSVYPEQESLVFQVLSDGHARGGEAWFWRKDGSGFPVDITVVPTVLHEGMPGALVAFRDITERKQSEERMRHQAQHDALTNLPNRALLNDRLQQALTCAKRNKQRVGLMFINLDHFKAINDAQGHVVGDWLLQQVTKRMLECVRDSDTVARTGGDEFVVLLRVIDSAEDAVMVAEKIRVALNQPFDLAQQRLNISCSIGISVYPELAKDETEMMNYADIAMYQAKQKGRDKVQVFNPDV
jgi:diguanylate cyclase (GGDEF)-like protein/PAS domain S-box-containing protein